MKPVINLRPNQEHILDYPGGKMGIVAVPGSGKTWTLSLLAAEIIARKWLKPGQEVLIVTLINSAVDNFYQRVRTFITKQNLFALDFRVRTLHGLAHDIVRERPELAGLDERFQIIDEREADRIRQEASIAWLKSHPFELLDYCDPSMEESRREWLLHQQLPGLVDSLALSFTRYAKDRQLTPEQLHAKLIELPLPLPLAEMGCEIYQNYQRALSYRGAVDFDDLIRLALQTLEYDPILVERLSNRWPYILEDEAQDSSQLQESILERLASQHGNWVRVGDPNQAIYETFTTANPKFLRGFVARDDVFSRDLPESGRSTPSIIWLANSLVNWTQNGHPLTDVRDALQSPPEIKPTQPGDPQPNPTDDPTQIYLIQRKYTPQEEVKAVVASAARWLKNHPKETLAILVPRNQRGFEVVDELRHNNLEVVDSLLRSTSSTRFSAKTLEQMLRYLSDPKSASKLADVWKIWRVKQGDHPSDLVLDDQISERIRKCERVEDYLWPTSEQDWLASLRQAGAEENILEVLEIFRQFVRRWQQAMMLPADQLVLTIGQDLFSTPKELAITHKLAVMLRQASISHPQWRLPELCEELSVIARNERRFLGFDQDETGFDPDQYQGKALVATMHKAKGLEWDRVYLMSVNNYDFPSGAADDLYMPERWFIRDHLNLEAETLAQLDCSLDRDNYSWYVEGTASQQARLDYIRERLRLLYVGITRARKELVITWNSGRDGKRKPALALGALQGLWEEHLLEISA
jgi:DNA helicase-2/ATP-dependent DNA helicase PcrA